MTTYMFEKPLGMRDTLPQVYEAGQSLKATLNAMIQQWGYPFVKTPALEYSETVGQASAIRDEQLFKFHDRQGRPVVLRPDMTSPIARMAASGLKTEPLPIRLGYQASVYRKQQYEGARPAEFEQTGVELIGDETPDADAEVMALMIQLLKASGLNRFKVAVGHAGFIEALFNHLLDNEQEANILRRYLYEKNDVGFQQHIRELSLSALTLDSLEQFLQSRMRPNDDTLQLIKALLPGDKGRQVFDHLSNLLAALKDYGVADDIDIDITLAGELDYYTGVVFAGYGGENGFVISNGGRYDGLLSKFNRPAPATGFGIRMDRLTEALDVPEQKTSSTCILFTKNKRSEALQYAERTRANCTHVVMQNINGVQNLDIFAKKFDYIIDFTDRREEEGNDPVNSSHA